MTNSTKILQSLSSAILFILLSTAGFSQTTQVFKSYGANSTVIFGAGVTTVNVSMWGGGGGGTCGGMKEWISAVEYRIKYGAGGGGSNWAGSAIPVIHNLVYPLTVGVGGSGGGIDGNNNEMPGGNGTTSSFQGVFSYGGYGGTLNGFLAYGGARAINSVPDPGAYYAGAGQDAGTTQGGNGGLTSGSPYGASGTDPWGDSGGGYPTVWGIGAGGPGLKPGDAGGGGGYTTLAWPLTYVLAERTFGGRGANGIVNFYFDYPTYRFTAPTTATKICGSGTSTITIRSTALYEGQYKITYNTTNPTTTGNVTDLMYNAGVGYFTTIPLSGSSTITITNLASGTVCSNAVTQFNTVNVIVENTTANDWNTQLDMGGSTRSEAVAFSIGGKAYVGTGKSGTTLLKDFWQFDQLTNTWTQIADFGGTARSSAVGIAIGTKGYVGTGNDGVAKNDFWEYEPFTNVWTAKANFAGTARYGAIGMTMGNKGYIGTGYNGSAYSNDFFVYDPTTNVWTAKTAFPGNARSGATAFSIAGKGYMGLGKDGTAYYKDFWEYNPGTNAWIAKTAFGGVARSGAAGFSLGNGGYVGTGWTGAAALTDIYEYWAPFDMWTLMSNFTGSARQQAVGFSVGSKGYIGTGLSGTTYYKDIFEFSRTDKSIKTGALSAGAFCAGSSVNIPFSVGCVNFINANTFTAQLSDLNGSFDNPVNIGYGFTVGNISATIPVNTPVGNKYRIRVTASQPPTLGTDNGLDIGIKPPGTATVTAGISNTSICRATPINLTATVTAPSTSDTTVILSENFNTGAASWLMTNTNSYQFGNTGIYTNGQSGFYSNDNSSFYLTSSMGAGSAAVTNTTLQSPTFSTLGMNSGTLSFYHHYLYGNYNNQDSIRVQVSTNQGQSWTTIYLNNTVTVGDPQDSIGFKPQSVSLNSFMNQPSVVLRFNYGALGGLGRWMIDNIVIKGISKSNNFSWTSNPAGFTSSLQNPTGVVPTLVPGTTVYSVAFTNNYGCGLVSNSVSVNVKDTSSSRTTISICPTALPYTWNGLVFNSAGTQTKYLINAAGCDSLAKLTLIVKPTSVSTTLISICPTALPYTWNGLIFNGAGSQIALFTNSVGCDSAATLILTVKPVSSLTINATICESSLPYVWHGLTFNAAGTQSKLSVNSVGCDSTTTLILTTIPSAVTAASNLTSVCPGAVINLSSSALGSVSTVNLINEKFNSTHNNWTKINLSSGGLVDSAAWTLRPNGYTPLIGLGGFSSNDNSQFYLTNSYAQGNMVTTNTILQSPVFSTVGLSSSSLSFYHYFSHQNNFANDSIRVQISADGNTWNNLYVNKTTSVSYSTIWDQQIISLNGYLNLPAARIRFVYNGTPINSGYSNFWWAVDNVKVTGVNLPSTYSWSSVPAGFTSNLQNPASVTPTQTTAYTVTVNNNMCTVSKTVNVTVNLTSPTSTTNTSICPNALPYVWNGLTFTASGSQTKTIITAGGCDSLATLNLTVKATSSSTTGITICPSGLPYTWNGMVFNSAGSQTKTLINSVGCDSLATLNLTVLTSSTSSVTNITVCEIQLPYTWNGLIFTGAGRQVKNLINSYGCDSAATLNLMVSIKPASVVAATSSPSVCTGTTVNLTSSSVANTILLNENFNGATNNWTRQNLSTGGTSPLASAWTLRPDGYQLLGGAATFRSNDFTQFYLSDSYSQGTGGITNTFLESPVFSTIGFTTASLTFYHMFSRRDAGDYIRVQASTDNGNTWTTIYTNTPASIGGYSNFVLQTVSMNAYINLPAVRFRFNYNAGGDFMWALDNARVTGTPSPATYTWSSVPSGFTSALQNPAGFIPVQSATYKVIATNSNGCKDSATVAVALRAKTTSSSALSVCASALPYLWNGLTFNGAGTQTATLINSVGCDSAATLILSVRAVSTSSNSIAVCQSAIPYSWNGLTFNGAGTQTATLVNSFGCDSSAALTLTINPSPSGVAVNASSTSVCAGTSVNLSASATSGITGFMLNENFNAPTNSWIKTNTVTGGNSAVSSWALVQSDGSLSSNDNSQYYMSNNAQLDYGKQIHVTLQSPPFSTVGFSTASLSFYQTYWHNPYDWDSIRAQVSTDGVNWNTVYLNNSTDVGAGLNWTFVQQTVSLNSYINQPNLRVRFNYNANWGGNFWGIDNVKVSGSPVNTYSWTSIPVGYTSTQQNPAGIIPAQTTTYSVAIANTGGCVITGNVLVTVKALSAVIKDSSICSQQLPLTWNGRVFNGNGTQIANFTNAAGCDSTVTMNVIVKQGKTWIGGNGNWSVAANWCGGLPAPGDSISIPAGNPRMDVNFTVAGKLIISGAGMLTINPLVTFTIAGLADFSGRPVTVRSDITGSGSIGTITGILNNATIVTIERYIPNYGYSAWNLLSAPTYGNGQTIRKAWQEGDLNINPFNNNLSGFGTLIFNTGTDAAAQVLGFDGADVSSSLLSYNGTAFQAVSATNTPIATREGYRLFVRGDRSINLLSGVNTATTLKTTGTIYQGFQTTPTIPANSFGLVGNPYASAINFTSLGRSGGTSNHFYAWDPKKSVDNKVGLYQTFSATNGFESLISGGSYNTSAPNTVIQSGQAFFAEASGTDGSFTIPEDSKLPGNGTVTYNSTLGLIKLDTKLYSVAGAAATQADANVVVFDAAYSSAVNGEDASKMSNAGPNLGILQNTKTLTVEGRQPVATADTIFFNMSNMLPQTYRLDFAPRNMTSQSLTARLEDSYLNTSTVLNMADTSRATFLVDAIPGSYAANRFRIVFAKTAGPGNCLGNSRTFTAAASGTTYQWQVNSGSGYTNIADGGIYSGSSTPTLLLTNVPTSYSGYNYRCVVNGANGPDNTLRFEITWTGAMNTDWATLANWSCPAMPDEYTDVLIPTGMPNYPIISGSTAVRKLTTMAGTSVTVGTGVNLEIRGR